jgi:hypothetical protein
MPHFLSSSDDGYKKERKSLLDDVKGKGKTSSETFAERGRRKLLARKACAAEKDGYSSKGRGWKNPPFFVYVR